MHEYLLLYNLFGYPCNGPKRALLRAVAEKPETAPVRWGLFAVEGAEVAGGEPKREPDTFDTLAYSCDFSEITWMELYTLRVVFSDGSETVSEPFEISPTPYLCQLSLRLSVHNARARFARGLPDGGYYDCNSRMGEAYSHGVFLNGLSWLELLHRGFLAPREREELRFAQQTAFDYLMRVYRPETGEFANQSEDRKHAAHNYGLFNSMLALYGACAYLSLHGREDPIRAGAENIRKLEKSLDWILTQASNPSAVFHYPFGAWLTVVSCHLYRVTGKKTHLDRARENLEKHLPAADLRAVPGAWQKIGFFEGMWLYSLLDRDCASLPGWRDCLSRAETRLRELLAKNAWQLPPLAHNAGEIGSAWDEMRMKLGGRIKPKADVLINQDMMVNGLQGVFLALLTGNRDFYRLAAAGLNFPCGLNFGVPGRLIDPPSAKAIDCASFIANTARSARPWGKWFFRMADEKWASIENGYSFPENRPEYDADTWMDGETFILTDGVFLQLASLYEYALSGKKLSLPAV